MVWVGLGFGLVKKNGLGWFGLLNLAETHTSSLQNSQKNKPPLAKCSHQEILTS